MNRLLLLLTIAAAGAGCGGRTVCNTPSIRVYWTPGSTPPVAGFSVPGLFAAGFPTELTCAEAGVAVVQIFVNGVAVSAGSTYDWPCTTGGVDLGGYPLGSGTNTVEIYGLDAPGGNLKYYGRTDVPGSCNMVVDGVISNGVAGPLGINYAFVGGSASCQSGSSIVWDLRSGGASGPAFDSGSIACGTTDPFDVYGGANVPAGVYTLVNVAEVVGSTSYHAYCSTTPFVHAGPESLLVDMPASTATCY